MKLSALSIEYVYVPVSVVAEGEVFNPSAVELAFPLSQAQPETWHTAEVLGDNVRLLVGPGQAVEFAAGDHLDVWVRVTDDPEIPVKRAGEIAVI